ncbi:MAG: hypothetical protein WA880_03080 [Ornithinimicrobium sp.]
MALVLVGFAVRQLFGAETGSAEAGDSSSGSTVTAGQTGSSHDNDATAARPDKGGSDSAEDSTASTEAEETAKAEEEADAEPAGTEMPAALQACVTEVGAGQEWAAATEGSAAHWKRHYGASVKYNASEITLKQAKDEFAESKAFADSDIKAVSAAAEDYEAAQGACSEVDEADMPDEYAEQAQACTARAAAIKDVVATGTEVNEDWATHVKMMKTKDEVDPDDYYERWQNMVETAPDNMGPYDDAADELDDAPTCPTA